jgi:hypothetical protein
LRLKSHFPVAFFVETEATEVLYLPEGGYSVVFLWKKENEKHG